MKRRDFTYRAYYGKIPQSEICTQNSGSPESPFQRIPVWIHICTCVWNSRSVLETTRHFLQRSESNRECLDFWIRWNLSSVSFYLYDLKQAIHFFQFDFPYIWNENNNNNSPDFIRAEVRMKETMNAADLWKHLWKMVAPAQKCGHLALVCIFSSLFLTFQITSSSVTALFKSLTFELKAHSCLPCELSDGRSPGQSCWECPKHLTRGWHTAHAQWTKIQYRSPLPTCHFSQRSHFIFTWVLWKLKK